MPAVNGPDARSGGTSMWDVIVVGAGPAGASAAEACASRGLSTIVFDRQHFPRQKPCGGALSRRALTYLGGPIPPELVQRRIYGSRVHYDGLTREAADASPVAVIVDRAQFDDYLLARARNVGAQAATGEAVRRVTDTGDAVEVETESGSCRGKLVVIAEGALGGLKTRVRRKDRPDEMAISAVTAVPATADRLAAFPASRIDVHFGVAGYGYGWVFPHDDHFSVGVGGMARVMRKPRRMLAEFLAATGFPADSAASARIHPLPAGGIRRRIAHGRILLAGDAAGFVDAFLGEGISFAIRSGRLAGAAAADAAAANPGTATAAADRLAATRYETLCATELGAHMRGSLFVAKALHAAPGVLLTSLLEDDRLAQGFLDIPTMRATYRTYIGRTMLATPRLLLRAAAIRTQRKPRA